MAGSNMICFVKVARGSAQSANAIPGGERGKGAAEIVAETILAVDGMKQLNEAASVLADLRRRADEGDEGAMYDANLQIEVVKAIRDSLVAAGLKPRFNSERREYELD